MTIEQTTKQWLKMLAARVKRRTLVRYRGIIARHIYPHLDVTANISDVSKGEIEAYATRHGDTACAVAMLCLYTGRRRNRALCIGRRRVRALSRPPPPFCSKGLGSGGWVV